MTQLNVKTVEWIEPNRANTPPLHIASRGDRYSTLTGVCWLDEFRFLVNHRSGLRLALFDLRIGGEPVAKIEIPHLTDDVAAKLVGDDCWEVGVTGCWDASYSLFHLDAKKPQFSLVRTCPASGRNFCHGSAYDAFGNLCLAFSTGQTPRIQIAEKLFQLPPPWGPRGTCYDAERGIYYAVAVSNDPKRQSYKETSTSIWSYRPADGKWVGLIKLDDVHSDACDVYKDRLWISDQKGDRVIGVCLKRQHPPINIRSGQFSFPHGLAISKNGLLAVTNYGSSSVTFLDISAL